MRDPQGKISMGRSELKSEKHHQIQSQQRIIHSWQVVDENFELESKYTVVDYLGAGAYGVVCAAYDNNEKRVVAIKKCRKIFQSRTMAKRTLRELRILI